jgi:hypothetical protein
LLFVVAAPTQRQRSANAAPTQRQRSVNAASTQRHRSVTAALWSGCCARSSMRRSLGCSCSRVSSTISCCARC